MGAQTKFFISALCATTVFQVANSLSIMELMAPYKLRNVGNGRYLTANHQGILGLKTGEVTTQQYLGRREQQWTIAWDPTLDDNHDGYRIESRMEYLNQVTSFYPDGSTVAMPNIWEVIELRSGARMFRNKRSRKCLQSRSSSVDVYEKTCSIQNKSQQWMMELLDLDLKIGGRKYRIRNPYWDLEEQLFDLENEYDTESSEDDY